MKARFDIGEQIYILDKAGRYFYLREFKIDAIIISANGIRYNCSSGIETMSNCSEDKIITKDEVFEKLKKWLY